MSVKLSLSPAPHAHAPQSTRALMGNVLIALLPCAVAGAGFFGWSAMLVMLVSTASAVLFEALWQALTQQKIAVGDLSAAVTGLILGMNLPARAPWWLAAVGSAFAVIVVKGLFGGLGDNFMNPALAARAMLLASWPRLMTAWCAPAGWNAVDALAGATPLANPAAYDLGRMLIGSVPGCIGETCKPAILIGLTYLLLTGTVAWRIPAAMVASAFTCSWILGANPVAAVLSGGLLFGAVYMATDYATCPMSPAGQLVYAAGAGALTAVIRRFGAYPEGVTYAILLMNIAAPLIDRCFRRRVYGHGRGMNAG